MVEGRTYLEHITCLFVVNGTIEVRNEAGIGKIMGMERTLVVVRNAKGVEKDLIERELNK